MNIEINLIFYLFRFNLEKKKNRKDNYTIYYESKTLKTTTRKKEQENE
jgi:hypothetical protein